MSIQTPAWLIALIVLPPLVLLTLRELRRRSERLTPGRTSVFLALRTAAIICLVLGLAGLSSALFTDRLAVVFLLDQSSSVSAEERKDALEVIQAIRARLGTRDSANLVRFGASAQTDALEPGVAVAP
ncbi:MAG TPA: hypothetical protein VL354_19730, partial [Spirochaetia bacterium]|nr:hypothetical protein [Spirochaetia bacterium]